MIKRVIFTPERIEKLEDGNLKNLIDTVVDFLDKKELCEKEEKIKIEPNKGYLLLENIGFLMNNSSELGKILKEIEQKTSNLIEVRNDDEENCLFMIFKSVADAYLYLNRIGGAINIDARKSKDLNQAINFEDISLVAFGKTKQNLLYKQYDFEVFKIKSYGIIAETIISDIDDTERKLEIIKEICIDNGFEYCLEDQQEATAELDKELFPNIKTEDIKDAKPDYILKQEKLNILSECNILHTSFYGIFKDILLGELHIDELKEVVNLLNSNKYKQALQILVNNIKE